MGPLSRAANANSNNSGIGKYDNNISGLAHKIFIIGWREHAGSSRREEGREGEEQSEKQT